MASFAPSQPNIEGGTVFYERREFELPRINQTVTLILWGDPHLDHGVNRNPQHKIRSLFDYETFQKLLEYCERPNTYHLCVGDTTDSDRRTRRAQLAALNLEDSQRKKLTDSDIVDMDFSDRYIVPMYKRLAPNCLGIIRGNHYRLYNNGQPNVDYICQEAGIKVLGEHRGYIDLVFKFKNSSLLITIFASHGSGSASTIPADMTKLKNHTVGDTADIYVAGHTHYLYALPDAKRFTNSGGIRQRHVIYARAGHMVLPGESGTDTYLDLVDAGVRPRGFIKLDINFWFTQDRCPRFGFQPTTVLADV